MIAHPVYTPHEACTRQTFLALMWSLSYPGRVHKLPTNGMDAFLAIGDTLLDLETSFYSPDNGLALHLSHTGARALPPNRAAYHFYPALDGMLTSVKAADVGTLLNPEQSATLILGCTLGMGTTLLLEGPGVPPKSPVVIQVSSIPREFWDMRTSANRYPRGWDVYLVAEDSVIGLPRSTQITVKE